MKSTLLVKILLLFGSVFIFFIVLSACKKDENDDHHIELTLLLEYSLGISEPSGLCLFNSSNEFLAVSDKTNEIYVVSNKGVVLRNINFNGQDLEGITYNPILNNIFITEETSRQIFRLDTNGVELSRFPIDIYFEEENHGPEGISYNPVTNHLFVVIEKKPAKLLEINLSGEILNSYSLSFADDYSAVYYDVQDEKIWILSDESKTLSCCNLYGESLNTYSTNIAKGEGLVIDPENKMAYIVSDQESKMYVFSIP